jgi:hypothetical protein
LETTAGTTADSENPRISGHRISQNIANAMRRASQTAMRMCTLGNPARALRGIVFRAGFKRRGSATIAALPSARCARLF